jgi:hypothetical protein
MPLSRRRRNEEQLADGPFWCFCGACRNSGSKRLTQQQAQFYHYRGPSNSAEKVPEMKLTKSSGKPASVQGRAGRHSFCKTFLALVLAGAAFNAAASSDPEPLYETGAHDVFRLTRDLCQSLEKDDLLKCPPAVHFSDSSAPHPVLLAPEKLAFLNQITHAKSIDSIQRGFFEQYAAALSAPTSFPLVEFPEWREDRFRGLKTMNSQASYFNQIAGGLVAIDMAHHYLGHYEKYAGRLADASSKNVPINSLVTWEEWHQAVMRGAYQGLTCGLSVEGLVLVYDLIALQPNQPAWATEFVCANPNLPKVKRDLKEMELRYFGISAPTPKKIRPDFRLANPAEW